MHFDRNLHTTRANQLLLLSLLSQYLPAKQTLFTDTSPLKLDALGTYAKNGRTLVFEGIQISFF